MPQMSPMSWTIIASMYLMMVMYSFPKMNKSNTEKNMDMKSHIKIMKMKW